MRRTSSKAMQQFAAVDLPGGLRPVILESWQRSSEAGVARDAEDCLLLHRIEANELARRLAFNAGWLEVARPLLDAFSRQMEPVEHVIYATDGDGIVLYAVGNEIWRATQGLWPGFDWSESRMGTNGAGTALATGLPVAVIEPEHYLHAFSQATCLASPLRDADGKLIGAVDLSTRVQDAHPAQLAAVVELAREIEQRLARNATTA